MTRYAAPLLLLLFSLAAFGQTGNPDCQFTATFTSATPGTAGNGLYNNKPTATGGNPCGYWELFFWTNGASSVSIQLEGSSDVAGVSSGSYTALTATQGTTNPSTSTTGAAILMCCDYYPWIRVNPTTFSGSSQTMTVRVYGWRTQSVNPGGSSGPTANVNVNQWGGTATTLGQKAMSASVPVAIASDQSAVAENITQMAGSSVYPCLTRASFNLSGSGDTQIIAASGSTTIRICHLSFATVSPEDIKITRGTGSNCASGTADVTGLFKSIQGAAWDWGPFSPLTGAASGAICINQSGTQALGGVVIYDQR